MIDREILSTIKAAELLGVSQQSVRKWCQSGKMKTKTTPGGFYKIELSELERFKEEYNMPDITKVRYVIFVDKDKDRIKFFEDLLGMMEFKVVTAINILDIGMGIGKVNPDLIILGTEVSNATLVQLLSELKETNSSIPVLIIVGKGHKIEDAIVPFKKDRRIGILSRAEPFDISQFKNIVTDLL